MKKSGKWMFAVAAVLGCAELVGPTRASAGLIVTIEAPGVSSSSVSGVTTESFNSLSPGNYSTYQSAIGTYTGPFAIVSPDAYGGALGSKYMAVGTQSGTTVTTLDLGMDRAYFGMYWSAGDAQNQLDFYYNDTLVRQFNTSDVISFLDTQGNRDAYYGNPDNGQDSWEPFAYLNFFGTDGTVFNKIVFRNTLGTGFESDNHSVRTEESPICGTPISTVPEPSSVVMIASGFGGLLFTRFYRRKR